MARLKNALTEYFVANLPDGYSKGDSLSEVTDWLLLAKYIQTVSTENNENTEDLAFYDGDGTDEQEVTSVRLGFSFSGQYDDEDPAQKLIADLEAETGDKRKIALKQVKPNGQTRTGSATVSGITAGTGDASEYGAFEATIVWNEKPEETVTDVTKRDRLDGDTPEG